MAAARNADEDPTHGRSKEDSGADTKHKPDAHERLWWSLSSSGDRITICLPEDPLSPDQSRTSTSSPPCLCDCCALSEHDCTSTVGHDCHLSVAPGQSNLQNCSCKFLKEHYWASVRKPNFDSAIYGDCDISITPDNDRSDICYSTSEIDCCECICSSSEGRCATICKCDSDHSKDFVCKYHNNPEESNCTIHEEKYVFPVEATRVNLDTLIKCRRTHDTAHQSCTRYRKRHGFRPVSFCRRRLKTEPNVRAIVNSTENFNSTVSDALSFDEESTETNSTLDSDTPETDCENVTVEVSLQFEGERPILSSPKFILRKPEPQENMEEVSANVKLSPIRPKVRFADTQEKDLEQLQTEDRSIVVTDVIVHNENSNSLQELSSPEDVKEGIDNTLKEIYELRKLLAELKHEKLGLNIPHESFKPEEEFQFQPDEICPSSTPVDNSSRESIDDLQNLLAGMNSPKNNASVESPINQLASGIPLGRRVTNGEAGQTASVEASQSGVGSPESPVQSMRNHLSEGQSDPAILSLAATSDTASKPVLNSSALSKKLESELELHDVRPKSVATARKKIVLKSASSNRLQVPEFEPNRRVFLSQPEQSSSHSNWSPTDLLGLREEPTAQFENQSGSSDSEPSSIDEEESISKDFIKLSRPPSRSSIHSAVEPSSNEFADSCRPPSRHSIRLPVQSISTGPVQSNRPSRRSIGSAVKSHDILNRNGNAFSIDENLLELSNKQSKGNVSVHNPAKSNRKSSAQSVRDFTFSTHVYEPVPDNSVIIPIDEGGVKYPYSENKSKSLPQSGHVVDNIRPESRSSVIVIDKPSSEPKKPKLLNSVIVTDAPKSERNKPESISSIIVLERPPSPRNSNHFRSSSVSELPRIVRDRDKLSSARSTRSVKSITHRYTPDLKPAIRVINPNLESNGKRDTISIKSVSFKLKNKPEKYVRSVSDEESSDSETETVFLAPLKNTKPVGLGVLPSSSDLQTHQKALVSEGDFFKEQNENNSWSVQVNEKPKNQSSVKSSSHTLIVKPEYSPKIISPNQVRNKKNLEAPHNEVSTSVNESSQENNLHQECEPKKDEIQTSTSKPTKTRENDFPSPISLDVGVNLNKSYIKPASAVPKRLISNRKQSGIVSARVTRNEKQSVLTSTRNFHRDKPNLLENRVSLKADISGLSRSRLNVNKNRVIRAETPLRLTKHQENRTDSRQSLNKSSISKTDSRLSISQPRESRANSRLSLNKTPISRSNSRASLLRNRKTDSRLSFSRVRNDRSAPSPRPVSSSPQPSIGSIRRKRARRISLENITKRSENKARERSLSRAREQNQNQIRTDTPKPASCRTSPKLPSTARTKRAGLVTAPVLTKPRTRTAISHRSVSSYSHRPRPFRKSSPSPERYQRNISKSVRGRTPETNRSNTARQSRSRSVRTAKPNPKKSLTRSQSNISMKETAEKSEIKRSRSLSTRRKSNPKKYELKVECVPVERKSSFNLDLVHNVKNKLKQVPSNARSQASNRVNSQSYFGISSNALTSQLSQNAYRPLDSHFEENILLGDPYTSREEVLPARRSNTGNLQAFSHPQHQPIFQNPRGYDDRMMKQRNLQYRNTGGRRHQPRRMNLGAWFRKWNPFRNLFGDSRPYPMHMRPKRNYGYDRAREFESLVPRKHPISKTNSSQQLFIQDPSNSGKILIAEEVGLVYGDPREILKKEKKKTEVAKGFLASLRKSSQDKKAAMEATTGTTKEKKRKKPRAKSREQRSRLGFNRKTNDPPGGRTIKSRLGFSRRKGSAKSVRSAKPKKKKKVRLSLADIAKRVQQNSRMSSSTSSGKRAKFATEGKLSGFGSVAKTAFKNKNIFARKSTNLGPGGTPKSILRGPPTQQYPTDPTATRPVHFRPGTIPAVNEIPRYAQASPQPLKREPLPPQPNKVRLDAMATNTMASEVRGQFYGRLHSGATRRQAEETGAHYGPPSGPPSRVPVPSSHGVGGRQFPLALPGIQRAPRPSQRSAARDTAIAMPSMQNSGSPPRHSAAPEVRMDSGGPGSPVFGGSKKEPKVPIVLMQGVFNRAAANTSLGRRAALEVEQLPLPPFLVEPTSRLRGALPVLPPSFASLCLCLNVCIPGLGTMVSGWLGLCVGRNRLAPQETPRTRGMSVLITMGTGLAQLAAVSFFLVGWFWSIAWGLLLVSISQKYLMYIDDHAKTMQGAVGLEMMSVNANAPDKANS